MRQSLVCRCGFGVGPWQGGGQVGRPSAGFVSPPAAYTGWPSCGAGRHPMRPLATASVCRSNRRSGRGKLTSNRNSVVPGSTSRSYRLNLELLNLTFHADERSDRCAHGGASHDRSPYVSFPGRNPRSSDVLAAVRLMSEPRNLRLTVNTADLTNSNLFKLAGKPGRR